MHKLGVTNKGQLSVIQNGGDDVRCKCVMCYSSRPIDHELVGGEVEWQLRARKSFRKESENIAH